MSRWERVLLYSTAVGVGMFLLLTDNHDASANGTARENGRTTTDPSARTERDGNPGPSAGARGDGADRSKGPSGPLVVTDGQGRPRIELRVGDRGQPEILLRSEAGETVLALRADSSDEAEITLATKTGTATLRNEKSGHLLFELRGKNKCYTRMSVTEMGETELNLGQAAAGMAIVRSDVDGNLEVGLRGADGITGPNMTLTPMGEGVIRVAGQDGTSGPVMQLFPDGLAQILIGATGNESGPQMIRLPDGMSVVAVRRPNGQPGAAMVSSPDGTSVVAATSVDGKQKAELRIETDGKARATVTPP